MLKGLVILCLSIWVMVLLEKNLKVVRLMFCWKVCNIFIILWKFGVFSIRVVRFLGWWVSFMVVFIMKFRVFLELMNRWWKL